jgi:hypothetical protein
MRSRLVFLILGSAALGGCAYGYGGYGSPYSGVSVGVSYGSYGGYGYGSGYGGYGGYGGYCSPYGSRYGCIDPYWGWFGNYYYPGTGYYVYDRHRRPHRWTDRQRRYWSERRNRAQAVTGQAGSSAPSQTVRPNWEGFNRERGEVHTRGGERRGAERRQQVQTRTERPTTSSVQPSTSESRVERRAARRGDPGKRRIERRGDD